LIFYARFNPAGDIGLPLPATILNCTYAGDVLVITSFTPVTAETKETAAFYNITCNDYKKEVYNVFPFDAIDEYLKEEPFQPFTSYRNAVGYMLEDDRGFLLPALYVEGPEIIVSYSTAEGITVEMPKEKHDTIVAAAKAWFLDSNK